MAGDLEPERIEPGVEAGGVELHRLAHGLVLVLGEPGGGGEQLGREIDILISHYTEQITKIYHEQTLYIKFLMPYLP